MVLWAFDQMRLLQSKYVVSVSFSLGLVPLFGIDVWEHAYYLQYKNVRPSYVNSIYNVANWDDVNERYQQAVGKAWFFTWHDDYVARGALFGLNTTD